MEVRMAFRKIKVVRVKLILLLQENKYDVLVSSITKANNALFNVYYIYYTI